MNTSLNISKLEHPDELHANEKKRLAQNLTHIASEAFGRPVDPDDVVNHVIKCDELYLTSDEERTVGFYSVLRLTHAHKKIFYLH